VVEEGELSGGTQPAPPPEGAHKPPDRQFTF